MRRRHRRPRLHPGHGWPLGTMLARRSAGSSLEVLAQLPGWRRVRDAPLHDGPRAGRRFVPDSQQRGELLDGHSVRVGHEAARSGWLCQRSPTLTMPTAHPVAADGLSGVVAARFVIHKVSSRSECVARVVQGLGTRRIPSGGVARTQDDGVAPSAPPGRRWCMSIRTSSAARPARRPPCAWPRATRWRPRSTSPRGGRSTPPADIQVTLRASTAAARAAFRCLYGGAREPVEGAAVRPSHRSRRRGGRGEAEPRKWRRPGRRPGRHAQPRQFHPQPRAQRSSPAAS
jgi:hypothetical protein